MILGESQQDFASPEEALAHYGVKGQRKGYGTYDRIDRKNGRDPKRLAILYGRRKGKKEPRAVQNKMAEHVNDKLGNINGKYDTDDFSNVNFADPTSWPPSYRKYHEETLTLAADSHRVAVKDVYGVTSAEKRRAYLDGTGQRIEIRDVKIAHAIDDDEVVATFSVSRDPKGLIEMVESLEPETEEDADILAHYGVKGMRWGYRNERETGNVDGLSKPGEGQVAVDPVTAAVGAFYIGVFLLATVATIRDIRRQVTDSGKKYQQQNKDVPFKKKPDLSKKAPPMDVDKLFTQVAKPVNPNYPKPGTKMNCRRATFTYEMRRRGYDVQATPSHFATGQDARGLQRATMTSAMHHESIWGQKEIGSGSSFMNQTPLRRSELIFDSLNKNPDGARGELGVGWKFGGGHSMAFEKVNGKAVVFDTQTSKVYRKPEDFQEFAGITHAAAFTRTDNVKLDEDFLRRWVVNN